MGKKSIKTKLVWLNALSILLSTSIIGTFATYYGGNALKEMNKQTLYDQAEELGRSVDYSFQEAVGTINGMVTHAHSNLTTISDLSDSSKKTVFFNEIQGLFANLADDLSFVSSYYLRVDPSISNTDGFYYIKTSDSETFVETATTDFSMYPSTDVQNVGWYYIPVEKKSACWLSNPYLNKELHEDVISYCAPFYDKSNQLGGVIGLDITISYLAGLIDNIQAFESGFGSLYNASGELYYTKDKSINDIDSENKSKLVEFINSTEQKDSLTLKVGKNKYYVISYDLLNDLKLVVYCSSFDIEKSVYFMVAVLLAMIVVVFTIFTISSFAITKKIAKPLDELTEAATDLANGKFDVNITYNSNNEIGRLADSFRLCAKRLNSQMSEVKEQAFVDPLTGVGSKAAYEDKVNQINIAINNKDENLKFAVVFCDVNNLKKVNDTYGHSEGDLFIRDGVSIITSVFKQSPVYRIGGDEFVTIVEGSELDSINDKCNLIERIVRTRVDNSFDIAKTATVAYGLAVYNKDHDYNFDVVLKRADTLMYENKKSIKRIISHTI